MSLKLYNYMCEDCGEPREVSVEFEQRDEPQECPVCGKQDCPRTWAGVTMNVSTSKLSQTMPEAAAKGRFDDLRRKQTLRKEKSKARQSGDRQAEKEIDRALGRKK